MVFGLGENKTEESVAAEDVGSAEEVLGDSAENDSTETAVAQAKAEAEAKAKEKPTYVCDKCGSISEQKGCVCCTRH